VFFLQRALSPLAQVMLSHLLIENFAIIEREELNLSEGFTVLTGETGAGKSIILDAVTLLLGGRASADMVRRGEEQALIEGHFKLSGEDLEWVNARLNALIAPGCVERGSVGVLTISRSISRAGKNKTKVNGADLRVVDLKALTAGLIEIVRQHESYALLDVESHLSTLDDFGGLQGDAGSLSALYERSFELDRERRQLLQSQAERRERLVTLEEQIGHVERLNPTADEDEALQRTLRVLRGAEELRAWVDDGLRRLYERDGAVLETLGQLERSLERLLEVDERLEAFAECIGRAKLELEELSHDLRRYRGAVPDDPQTLAEQEERLEEIEALKERYGLSLGEILDQVTEASKEREALLSLDERIGVAEREATELRATCLRRAEELSLRRRGLANQLSEAVEGELKTLGMAQCRFKVSFERRSLSRVGVDQVEFLISPNPGEGFKPLARIASGGELSRLTLALKVVLMHSDPTPTYIFDEVDSGIGGGVAEGVGQKLRRIAGARQVACITHLPQVASCAHHHMKIKKVLLSDRTFSSIDALSEQERVEELARMLGGQDLTEATYLHAKEMIQRGARVQGDATLTRPRWSEVGHRAPRSTPEPRARVSREALQGYSDSDEYILGSMSQRASAPDE